MDKPKTSRISFKNKNLSIDVTKNRSLVDNQYKDLAKNIYESLPENEYKSYTGHEFNQTTDFDIPVKNLDTPKQFLKTKM